MDFEMETIALLLLAFAVGAAMGFFFRRRSRRRASPLADTVLLPLDETASSTPAESLSAAPPPEQPERLPFASEATFTTDPAVAQEPPAAHVLPAAPKPVRRRQGGAEAPMVHPGRAPAALRAPNGAADDLKRLKGVGPQNERRLNGFGIFHFAQIVAWTPDEAQWIGAALGFPGRVEREDWIGQARALAGEGMAPTSAPAAIAEEPDEAPLFPELDAAPPTPRPRRRR